MFQPLLGSTHGFAQPLPFGANYGIIASSFLKLKKAGNIASFLNINNPGASPFVSPDRIYHFLKIKPQSTAAASTPHVV